MTVYYFQQFVLHPIVFLYLQNLVFVLIIAFTTPSSLLRLAVLPLFLAAAYPVTLSCLEALYRYAWAGFVGGYIIFSLLGYVEIALISKWSFDVKGPTYFPDPGVSPQNSQSNDGLNASSKTWSSSEILERLKFGYLVATNNRNIGTPYIVKNTPSFSSKDPAYIPSRTAFCLRKLLIIISTFLLIDLVSQNPTTLEQNEKLYPADTVRIFTGKPENLKMDQVLTRLVTVLMYWICTAMVIDASTSAIQLVSVALHIKPVKMYRPNFGPIGEAYTIRQFWG
ncbi:MAG: hypothetical protein LQ351_000154 [Letrouitia transgressa]|nr:MAG: hypothetical protein LQ351_000154 [Letrouitia transgressa]